MKKIGGGLQFNVYSSGNKVIKIPTSRNQMEKKLVAWDSTLLLKPSKLKKEIDKSILIRKESIEKIKNLNLDLELLANPVFNENKIEQDKVVILKHLLKKDFEESKNLIEGYIQLIFECWEYGFSERVFNLTINNGINAMKKVVLIDFGEVTFNKLHVEKAIKIRRWEKSWSFNWDMKKKIKTYYKKRMKEEMTLFNLNKYWNRKFAR